MRKALATLAVVLTVACGEERKSDAELQAAVAAYLGQDVGVGAGDAKLGADGDVGDAAGLSDGEVGSDGGTDAGSDGDGGVDADGPTDGDGGLDGGVEVDIATDDGDGDGQDGAEVLDAGPCSLGNCDDGNPCTTDSCNPAVGCQYVNIAAACDDGDACTSADVCTGGACKGAGPVCGNGACNCGETVANCTVDCKAGTPAGMVLIPGGTFWMGCNAVKDAVCGAKPIEGPQHKVSLSAYYIDLTEVTVAEYKKCVDAGSCAAPAGDGTSTYCNWDTAAKKAKVGRAQHPVNCVNWAESQKFCNWRGAQAETPADAAKYDLPTEAQWEMAARGSCEKNGSTASDDAGCKAAMRTYPWGEQPATCSFAVMDDGGYGCGAVTTAAVGSKAAGDSPYGIRDMAGNVYEWTRDWQSSSYYAVSPVLDPFNTTVSASRVHRGGGFMGYYGSSLRSSERPGGTPSQALAVTGLRCTRSYP